MPPHVIEYPHVPLVYTRTELPLPASDSEVIFKTKNGCVFAGYFNRGTFITAEGFSDTASFPISYIDSWIYADAAFAFIVGFRK